MQRRRPASTVHVCGPLFFAARVRDEFLKRAPSEPESSAMEGGRFDPRRWHGRSVDACVQAYNKARSQCAQFEGCWLRFDEANLTGGVSGDEKC
jgi:hypothetical protein